MCLVRYFSGGGGLIFTNQNFSTILFCNHMWLVFKTYCPTKTSKTEPFMLQKPALTKMDSHKSPSEATYLRSSIVDVKFNTVKLYEVP